jgi:lambda family phage tail tape measure protein
MANLAVTLELDSQGYIRNIKAADGATKDFANDASRAFNKVDQSMDQLNQQNARLSQGFGNLRSAIAGVAIGAFIGRAIASADAISDLSDATDLSIGKLLEFEKALVAAGGKGDDAAKAITSFYASIQQANSGTDKTQEQFQKLGVSLKDLKTLSESELLDKTIKGFKEINDPVLKSTLAVDIFSKVFKTVDPNKLSGELDKLRGTLGEQERAAIEAAAAIDRFDKFMSNLRGAVLLVVDPLLKLAGASSGTVSSSRELADAIKVLVAAYVALRSAAIGAVVAQAAMNALMAAGAKGGKGFAVGGLGAIVAATAAYQGMMALMKDIESQAGNTGTAVNESLAESQRLGLAPPTQARPVRAQEVGKELQGQLNAVQNLADGYRRIAQANQDRMTLEVDILGINKEEADTMKGLADINKRYADQTAALEEKKKGAKGATLALINKEIGNLKELKNGEVDIFNITRERTIQYARQQQELKNILDYMEQMAKAQEEIASFQTQQDSARISAFEQVKAQSESLALITQREQLEKSIMNMRGSDQENIKKLFDLEQQRKTQLEAIQKIQNLPFEGVGGMKQKMEEINVLYDERRAQIELTAAATKAEQDSFAYGWQQASEKYRNNIKTDAEYAAQQMSNFTKGFEDAFVKFVQTGKLSIKDLANSMIADFARVQAQKILSGLFGMAGGGGGLFGGIAKIFGFANGGVPPVGQPSIVGERGPELFVPQSAGRIIPNHALGNGGGETQVINTAVTYSIQAVDASSFRTLLARDPEFLHNVSEQGRRSLPIRSRR